jgi:hypothetical protein
MAAAPRLTSQENGTWIAATYRDRPRTSNPERAGDENVRGLWPSGPGWSIGGPL